MAKKDTTGIDYKEALLKSTIHKVRVVEEMKKSFISYAMAVNVSRAIPDVRDGLKPVHRRILYAMGELNLFHDKPKRKCAKVVGDVLGKYHPHGESAVYDALVRLAQDFTIRCPLVEGQGNFGSVDGDPPAAQRYTEARLSKICYEMLRDIDKETVDFYPSYDESHMQPVVLPARFPNLLVNGADGIAVGMATNIPPHNLGEVIDGVIAQLDNPDITVDELIEYISAPDYPTGGIVMGIGAVRNAYRTGKGGFICRAKTEIEEYHAHGGTRSRIIVTELPYQVNKARLIEQTADLVKEKRIEGISDISEESDRSGMRIVIEVKRDANAQVVLNSLFKHTQLQISGGINLLTLVNGQPTVLNLKEIIGYYIDHQKDVIVRRTRYDLDKAEERRHILEGLVIALNNIDKVVEIIKSSRDSTEAAERLATEFTLSERQVKAILEMQLQRLTHLQVENLNRELGKLVELISELQSILDNPFRVVEIIKSDLLECKENYDTPRRTEISMEDSGIDLADLIENHECIVSLTREGYIKRLPINEYKSQRRGGVGVTAHKPRDEDFVERMFSASSHDDLLFFTDSGKVFSIKTYEIPEAQKASRGRAVINIIPLAENERITAVIPFKEGTIGNLFMATRTGFVKKTDLDEFASIRKGGKIAISLTEGDSLVSVNFTSGANDLVIASHKGMCIRFNENNVRQMGRVTRGVMSLKLAEGDYIVDMALVYADSKILTVTENGYGKISGEEDFRLQSRRGKGVYAGVFNQKTGNLVAMKTIEKNQDVMLISDGGICIRFSAEEINELGRRTQGVRIMKFKDDNAKVVAVALTEREVPEDETADIDATGDENITAGNHGKEAETADAPDTDKGSEN